MLAMPHDVVEYVNVGLMGVGAVILLATLTVVTVRRQWRAAISTVPARTDRIDLIHVAVLMLCFLLLMAGLSQLGRSVDPPSGLSQTHWIGTSDKAGLWPIIANNVAKLVLAVLVCVLAWVLMRGEVRRFGLSGDRIGRDCVWAVLVYLVMWPVCTGLGLLIVWLWNRQAPVHDVLTLLRVSAMPTWGTIALWVSAIAISPVAEELFFRGLLQTAIRGYVDRPWLAIVVASVGFALMHYRQPEYVVPLAVLGAVLGYVYEHTGSLIGPILIHVLFNSCSMVLSALRA